jgi:succinoglycan biosynthesis protein ExoM
MDSKHDHITVCICTYKRPKLLEKLLKNLQTQQTDGLFTYSVVVVDNDCNQSARGTIECLGKSSRIDIDYYVEPEQNIALARNKAVENARGNFIAFIDDDEFPGDEWLLNLQRALIRYNVDGVLGPVKPHFETPPPPWIIKGKIFERLSHETGTFLSWENTRTGNVLLKKSIFEVPGNSFNPAFGSGGEDRDFFKKMIEKGHLFIWCKEAPVYEIVPQGRFKRTFMLKRALLRGKVSLNSCNNFDVVKSVVAVTQYTLALPFLIPLGQHRFMRLLIKDFDHLGRLMAFCGISAIKEKYLME